MSEQGRFIVSLNGTGDIYHLIPVEELIERQQNMYDFQESMIRRAWKIRARREQLKTENAALQARVKELEKALRPFALHALDSGYGTEYGWFIPVTIGHLREAARVLGE